MDGTAERHKGDHPASLVQPIPPFIGRRKQLDWFARCIQSVIAGHPRVVLIPGEAGLGKTRLLQEVGAEAVRRGLQVYLGRSDEELALPYLPFVKVLTMLWEQVLKNVPGALDADAEIIRHFLYQDRAGAFPTGSSIPP